MSVSGVNSNSMSSIYGNRNVISGLASGMDTEGMIENAVSGIRTKIANLQRSSTKYLWKQDAYRSLSDQLVQFSRKYTSYTSSTNLMSSSFFDKAVITTAGGENSKYVSASGKSNSNVEILSVDQLASAARYATKTGGVLSNDHTIKADAGVDLGETKKLSTISGSMTFAYGKKEVSISLGEEELFASAQDLADAINTKLGAQDMTVGDTSGKASDFIEAKVGADGNIELLDKKSAGNNVFVSGASDNIKEVLGFETGADEKPDKLTVDPTKLTEDAKTKAEYMSGKKMTINYNGTTKSINMPTVNGIRDGSGNLTSVELNGDTYDLTDTAPGGGKEKFNTAYVKSIQKSLDDAFGKTGDVSNVQVSNLHDGVLSSPGHVAADGEVQLEFKMGNASPGNTLSINSTINTTLGLDLTETSYLNTGKSLKDLLSGTNFETEYGKIEVTEDPSKFTDVKKKNIFGEEYVAYQLDSEGYRVKAEDQADGTKKYYRVDTDDPNAYMFKMEVNGKEVGQFSKNTALETVMLAINNSDAGVKVNYSKLTNEMVFTAKETGANGKIDISDKLSDGTTKNIAADLFGVIDDNARKVDVNGKNPGDAGYDATKTKFTAGTDAKAKVTINGTQMEITRTTNTFDLDGLSVTVNGKFTAFESGGSTVDANKKVTFSTVSDADKIVDAVKSMIEDYNKMVTDIKEAFSTAPAYKNKSTLEKYEPLTDDEAADLSDTALKNYEEKAKQGLLFADQDLSSLYDKLKSALAPSGNDGSYLRSIGITSNYTDGLSTIELDENALRDALSNNPDAVKEAFTRTKGSNGATTNGIMQNLKTTLDRYAGVEGANKGILINKAGSKYSATSLLKNSLQDSMDNVGEQITKWEEKLSDKVDYYTRKFTQLEKLIAQMNSQSSSLMGMMGGGQ